MSVTPPDIPVKPIRRSLRERFSVVWLVPFLALLIALGVAYQSYSERGPTIIIAFDAATGVKAGETELKYRDITVGLVEKVGFSPSLETVEVMVRLDKEIAPYIDGDASFWVVRPEVSAAGVSGLDTVLSGVFIEGFWDSSPTGLVAYHQGLTDAPLLDVGEKGLKIVLRATEKTTLAEKTPILYKGIVVGRTGKPQLVGDGSEAVVDAVIYSPHDKLVSSATRFWDTSGFSFSIGAGGAELDFSSLASLISGGVTFETILSGGVQVGDGVEFSVYADEETARSSVFSDSSGPPLQVAAVFSENVSGLTAGANVELGGVRIGEVLSLRGLVDEARFGDTKVRLMATMAIRPERLGIGDAVTPDAALEFLGMAVEEGLRARLATSSILTGGLKIEMIRIEDAPAGLLEQPADGPPVMPSTDSNIKDVAATAEGVLKRINELPIEEMLNNVVSFLDSAKTLIGNEDLQRAPGEIIGLVEDARGVIGSEGIQALPEGLSTLMASLTSATEDMQSVLAKLDEADAVNRLLAAVDAAGAAAGEVGTTLEGVPDLITKIDTLVAKANELPIEDLLAQVTDLTASAKTLLASEATQGLPDSAKKLLEGLDGATADLRGVLTQINDNDTVNRLLAAIDAAAAAAGEVGTSMQGVPDLITQIDALVAKATALPLENLVSEATAVMASAEQLLALDSTKALPGNLNTALSDLRLVIDEITSQEGVSRLLAAIDAAGEAATKAGTSFDGVPELVDQISAVANKANELPLDKLVEEISAVMDSANAILATQGAQDLPASLSAALEQVDGVLSELRAGGTVQNINSTLASAANAADAVAQASADLPGLIRRVNTLINQAASTLASVDGESPINRDVRSALRQVEQAAQAISKLARAIERRPNSIILGR